jgi:hypothetical protein
MIIRFPIFLDRSKAVIIYPEQFGYWFVKAYWQQEKNYGHNS